MADRIVILLALAALTACEAKVAGEAKRLRAGDTAQVTFLCQGYALDATRVWDGWQFAYTDASGDVVKPAANCTHIVRAPTKDTQ